MESKAKLAGHAVHPIMVVFSLGLLVTSVLFDGVYLLNDNPAMILVKPEASNALLVIAALAGSWFCRAIFVQNATRLLSERTATRFISRFR